MPCPRSLTRISPSGRGGRVGRSGTYELFVGHVRGEYEARLTRKRGSGCVAANALAGENFRLDNVPSRIRPVPNRLHRPRPLGTTADEKRADEQAATNCAER